MASAAAGEGTVEADCSRTVAWRCNSSADAATDDEVASDRD